MNIFIDELLVAHQQTPKYYYKTGRLQESTYDQLL
jgi:hypothetical protein